MSRPLSVAGTSSVLARDTDLVWLVLLTIDHADLAAPIRVVNNTADVTSRGDVFVGFPFKIEMPQEREDQLPEVSLVIDNVDRQIVTAVRVLSSPPSVTMEVVSSADFDTVEAGPFAFVLQDVQYDKLVVQGRLAFEPILDEPYPFETFTPASYPGLF